MECQLYRCILTILATIDHRPHNVLCRFSDARIVQVWYWAVIHDRPVSWACQASSWPPWWRGNLPSGSTLSRRLRRPSVKRLLQTLERRVTAPERQGLFWKLDGKPLPIGGCSKDRQAGYGRAAGGKAKGYKLHAIVGNQGRIAEWRVAPMNKDERIMAARMLRDAQIQGYVVADSNYDSNPLHAVCEKRGELQLVTRRRGGPGRSLGHRRHTKGRLRSIALLENPRPDFGTGLMHARDQIERDYGNLTNWGGGLSGLPSWVRTYPRVYRWVQAKLTLTALRRTLRSSTYDD